MFGYEVGGPPGQVRVLCVQHHGYRSAGAVSTYGEFFGEIDFPDALEDEEEVGLAANGTGEVFFDDAQKARVAMDAFLERGGEGPADPAFVEPLTRKAPAEKSKANVFLAQTYGPQSGYAYEIDLDNFDKNGDPLNWTDAHTDDWDHVLVDLEDFGAEVGVIVLDGVEMRVWERADVG